MEIVGRLFNFALAIMSFTVAVSHIQLIIDGVANSDTAWKLVLALMFGAWCLTDAVHYHYGRK